MFSTKFSKWGRKAQRECLSFYSPLPGSVNERGTKSVHTSNALSCHRHHRRISESASAKVFSGRGINAIFSLIFSNLDQGSCSFS